MWFLLLFFSHPTTMLLRSKHDNVPRLAMEGGMGGDGLSAFVPQLLSLPGLCCCREGYVAGLSQEWVR